MDRREILITRYGEMMDMIACLSIFEGTAVPKKKKSILTDFDEIMRLR